MCREQGLRETSLNIWLNGGIWVSCLFADFVSLCLPLVLPYTFGRFLNTFQKEKLISVTLFSLGKCRLVKSTLWRICVSTFRVYLSMVNVSHSAIHLETSEALVAMQVQLNITLPTEIGLLTNLGKEEKHRWWLRWMILSIRFWSPLLALRTEFLAIESGRSYGRGTTIPSEIGKLVNLSKSCMPFTSCIEDNTRTLMSKRTSLLLYVQTSWHWREGHSKEVFHQKLDTWRIFRAWHSMVVGSQGIFRVKLES